MRRVKAVASKPWSLVRTPVPFSFQKGKSMATQIFVNLPVKNLDKSVAFFKGAAEALFKTG